MPGRKDERFDAALAIRLDRGEGVTRNVSASGLFFVTDVELEKGMAVSFTVEFGDSPGGPLRMKCEARIVRLERLGGRFGVGAAISHYELSRGEPDEAPALRPD